VQLAAFVPVLALLDSADAHIVVVATCTPKYLDRFVETLGFPIPGTIVFDPAKATHKACGLRSSVYSSLVDPFKHHLRTFGVKALKEALLVSLKNATKGHGSSWQQGGTVALQHGESASSSPTSSSSCACSLLWRESYPGDWKPIDEVLRDGLSIEGAPAVDYKERLDFVIKARGGKGSRAVTPTSPHGSPDSSCSRDGACSARVLEAKLEK